MNFIGIANTFFNIEQRVNEEDLDLYKHLINRLSILKSIIKNRNILQIIQNNGIQLPLGGFIKIRKRLNKKHKIDKQKKLLISGKPSSSPTSTSTFIPTPTPTNS